MSKKSKFKLIPILILIIVTFIIILLASICFNKSILSSDAIVYRSIEIADNSLTLKGYITNSYSVFYDYDYKIKDDKVFITLYQSNFKTHNDESSKINIYIKDDFESIRKIYQINSRSEDPYSLIWSKSND